MPEDRFLLVRLGSLGDIVHALPAASALRDSFPQAKIDWLVEPKWKRILDGNRDISEVITLNRGTVGTILRTVRTLRAQSYSCAIDFQGLYKSALVPFAARIPRRIGFQDTYAREGFAANFYTETFNPVGAHKVDHNLTLVRAVGAGGHHAPLSARDPRRRSRHRERRTRPPQTRKLFRAESRRRLAIEMLARRTLRPAQRAALCPIRLARA